MTKPDIQTTYTIAQNLIEGGGHLDPNNPLMQNPDNAEAVRVILKLQEQSVTKPPEIRNNK